jgi:hypothetical protein
VHGDNWVAITVVGIVFAVCIVILLIVLCCLGHQSRKASRSSVADTPVDDDGNGETAAAADVDQTPTETTSANARIAIKQQRISSQILSDHLSAASTGMVFTVADKFAPNGKIFKKA